MSNKPESCKVVSLRAQPDCQTCRDDIDRIDSLGNTVTHMESELTATLHTCPACGQPGSAVYRVTGVYGLKALQDWLNGVVREN